MKKVAIIGAGASGLMCAILCARANCSVDIFEQNAKCAKKILVSGNGRCNITNLNVSKEDYFGENPDFATDALSSFSYKDFEKFAQSIGLLLDVKGDNKVYPLSNEAKSVAFLLESHARNLGVNFHTENKITNIHQLFEKYEYVVVATGSQAANHLGGNNDGHIFAQTFGHNIIPTYPSLVQLELEGNEYAKMSGEKLDGEVSLYINNQLSSTCKGDILFTNYGVSGFAILDISQAASEALINYQTVDISLNLLPRFTTQQLASHLLKIAELNEKITLVEILHGILPIKTAKTILESLSLQHSATINTKLAKTIANKIHNFKFAVSDTHGFRHAEVSGGGVDTQEIDSKTMQSLKKEHLYFCGEVIDIVGRRGGFNFAWAWASAYACSQDIIKK